MAEALRLSFPEAYFREVEGTARFCVLYRSAITPARGNVIYIAPFGEEANACRRHVAQQARQLATAGYTVLGIDLFGCGDSDGKAEDIDWNRWIADVQWASSHIREYSAAPLWLWGVRSGTLLATAVAEKLPELTGLLLWQPVLNGAQYLGQLKRQLQLSSKIAGANASSTSISTPLPLDSIGGYPLPAEIQAGLHAAAAIAPQNCEVILLEASLLSPATLSPASTTFVTECTAAGNRVQAHALKLPSYWQQHECPSLEDLHEATLHAFSHVAKAQVCCA